MTYANSQLGVARRQNPMGQPYWLFLLFALYGPAISIVGDLRYAEIAVILLLLFGIRETFRNGAKWELVFAALFVATAVAQVISDRINGADIDGTLKRSFTYLILALLIVGVRFLSRGRSSRIRWIVAGYCFSYVTMLIVGQSASLHYADMPWRLGLGEAATTAICLAPFWKRQLYPFLGPSLIVLGVLHTLSGSRALAVIAVFAGCCAIWGYLRGKKTPPPFRLGRVVLLIVLCVVAGMAAYQGARWATGKGVLPAELDAKMQHQLANPYGLLASARPDSVAALYGITRRPLLGYGSTNVDPEVYKFYVDLSTADFVGKEHKSLVDQLLGQDEELGTPSHSLLFGAWVDAGIFAAISWMAFLFLTIYVLARSASWRGIVAPLFIVVALLALWDTLFSPGPIRMDVAIKFAILSYALDCFRGLDEASAKAREPASALQHYRTQFVRRALDAR